MSSPLLGPEQKQHSVGGLCHLVEAATALSKLVDAPNQTKDQIAPQQLSIAPSVPTATVEKSVVSDDDDSSEKNRCKREIFPQRLMAILNDASLSDIVTWLPNGRSFVIVRPDVFTDTVLPKYLPPVDARGSTKYPSFTRKLNRWGFRQITRGPDTGAFSHPLFVREQPVLCLQMVCQRSRDRRSSNTNKSVGSRSLPPKKRSSIGEGNEIAAARRQDSHLQQIRPTLAPTLTTACVSSDDNASSSGSSASASTTGRREPRVPLLNVALPVALPPPTVCTNTVNLKPAPPAVAMPKPPSAYVSKDEAMIKDALRQSSENERIRIAKAMLYHSYMQALAASR